MSRGLGRYAILLTMLLVGLVLAADIAYFARGSLEEFPTPEQVDKVRRVTAIIAALLILTEMGLWSLLRRSWRAEDR